MTPPAERSDAHGWRQRGHIRARRPGEQVGHRAWWRESAHVPSSAGGRAEKYPPAPYPPRRYGGTGAGWPPGLGCTIDDGGTENVAPPASTGDHVAGLSAQRTESGSWSTAVPDEGSFAALPGSRRA